MKLLLIDTCGVDGSAALADTERPDPVVETVTLPGRSSSERLLPEIRRMMTEQGWKIGDLHALGVVSGPGSFTGVRVGVAAAKGLCEAGGAPLVLVSRLAVLARKAGGTGGRIHAVLEAGRSEFYHGRFGEDGVESEELLSRADVISAASAEGGVVVVAEEGALGELEELRTRLVPMLQAADCLGLVSERVQRGEFDDVAASDASYLRRTELEVQARLERAR